MDAELTGIGSNVMLRGGVKLLQVEVALHRLVSRCAGRPDDYAVKLKVPTDGGLPGLTAVAPTVSIPSKAAVRRSGSYSRA